MIEKTFGCCRFAYNYYLSMRKGLYDTKKAAVNDCACSKDMADLKETLPRLRVVDSTTVQSSLKDLDAAYQDFFRRVKQKVKPGYPRFKSKHDNRQSDKKQMRWHSHQGI